jgi:hypothetical protein
MVKQAAPFPGPVATLVGYEAALFDQELSSISMQEFGDIFSRVRLGLAEFCRADVQRLPRIADA